MSPIKVAEVAVVRSGAIIPRPPYVKLVAPVPDCHVIVKPVLVIDEDAMTGAVGAAINVVIERVFEAPSPPVL